MFEYQTAISELTALPVSNASVYEGPSAVGGRRLPGEARQRQAAAFVVSARRAPAQPRDAARPTRTATASRSSRSPLRDGVTDAEAWARRSTTTPRRSSSSSRTSSARSRTPRRWRPRPSTSPAVVVGAYDPIPLGILKPPGECGVDVAVGEGQPLGNRLDFGGPSFGFFAATEAYLRRMPGPDRGRDDRRRRPPRLRPDAADARAAHPPREGDVEHLHRAGAQRARRRRLPGLAGPARASSSWASCCCSARTTRARRWPRSTASRRCTTSRSCASSRVTLRWPASRRSSGSPPLPAPGRQPGLRARPRLRGAPRRAAGRDHRAALEGRHRPAGRRARARAGRRAPGGGGMSTVNDNRLHGDPGIEAHEPHHGHAASRRGDRRDAAAARPGPDDLREGRPGPARLRLPGARRARAGRRGAAAGAPAAHDAPRAARGLRAGDRPPLREPLEAQLRPRLGLLPARLVHDEAQPAPARARRGAARATRACTRSSARSARRARWS